MKPLFLISIFYILFSCKPIYQKNQALVLKSPMFKAMESEVGKRYMQKSKTMPAGSEKANESKMMNENKIRAIIRHELIQSMKK